MKHVGTADRKRLNMSVNTPARVNTFKCLTHVGYGEGEPTVLGSGPRWWHCILLKVGKESV